MPRVISVIAVVLLALAVVAGVSYAVRSPVRSLALDLPQHKHEIAEKLVALREASKGSWIDRIGDTIKDIEQLVREANPDETVAAPAPVLPPTSIPASPEPLILRTLQ